MLDLLGNRKHQRRSFSTSSTELSQRDDTNDGSGGARAKSKSVSFNVGCKKKACHGPPLIRTMPRVGGAQGKSKAESSSKRSFMGPSLKKLGLLFSKFNGHMSEPSSEPMYTISDGIVQPHYMWQDITVDGSPPGSPVPRILQGRTLEWVAISFSNAANYTFWSFG